MHLNLIHLTFIEKDLSISTKYIVLIFLIGLSILTFAQEKELVFSHYGVEDGLSQSEGNCVFQDSRGLIWIGTQAGLNRFDGKTFISYDKNPLDPNSISSSWVYAIAEDKEGNLWLGTQNGLNKFNPSTGQFTHYLTNPDELKEKESINVYAVLYVNGVIWIKTDYTISKFLPKENRFVHYSHKKEDYFSKPKIEFSLPIIKSDDGIWAGSSFGLQFYSFEHDQVKTFLHVPDDIRSIPDDYVTAIAKDNSNNLFIGTENGIAHFDSYSKKCRPKLTDELNAILDQVGNRHVSGIVYVENGHSRELLISTFGGGLVVYDIIHKTYNIYREDVSNPQSLAYNRIKSLFRDQSGNLWLGLNGKGVDKSSPNGIKFMAYRNSGNSGVKLSDNMIASLYANQSDIWVGTWGSGLNIMDRKTKDVTIINTKGPTGQRIVDDHVHTIYKDDNARIWLGTRNGISIYVESTQQFYSFEEYFGVDLPDNMSNARINVIEAHSANEVFLGSSKGFCFFNLLTKKFEIGKGNQGQALSSIVYDFYSDQNAFWVATETGFYKFSLAKKFLKVFKTKENLQKNAEGVYNVPNSSTIYDIAKDKYGNFWLATQSGLNKFDPKKETYKYYTKENNGLPDNTIYELLMYNGLKLWFSTNRGLGLLNVQNDSLKTYTNADGLQSLEFNNGASYHSSLGEFLFGGLNGFNVFFPDSIRENSNKPVTTFLSFTLIDKNGKIIINPLFGVDKIHMSYDDNSVKIYFAALEYTNPTKNSYQYKLDGLNDTWVNLEQQNSVFFPSLNPGEYTLRIRGSNNDQIWGDEVTVSIVVSYPIYANIWAYLFYFLIVVLIIYRIWRTNRNEKLKTNEDIRNKQMLNLQLERQKSEIDVQHTAMRDSINYAKHIQEAMLPSEYLLKKLLPNSFVLYMTKDIVSGDFYWIAQRGNKTFIAAVDCTGHGVPGAFMSIIGFDLLKNIVRERGVEDPSEILNQLNYGVSDTFRKSNTDTQKVRDGMDMALCVIDHTKHTVEFSGAINPMVLIRDGSISLLKGNRFSIGSFNDDENNKFEKHTIQYKAGDCFYMFSDGYADQFGGPFAKKFKQKRFLHLLLNIHHLPMEKQKYELKENFNQWRDQIEQVDDVLVIGFKL